MKKSKKNRKKNRRKTSEISSTNPFQSFSLTVEKNTVIVLIAAAVVFLCMFFFIHSGSRLSGLGYGTNSDDSIMAFEKAKVTEIISDTSEVQKDTEGALRGTQELNVTVKSGDFKGQNMVVYNYFGANTGGPVSVGDSVIITIKTLEGREPSATVYEYNRIPVLIFFLILFFTVIILVGGRTGIKSLAGLVFTVICLFTILIPLLLMGAPTVFTTFMVCAYIALVSFTILGGVQRKTVSAFLGTVSGTFLAMILGLSVQHLAKIDGLRLDAAEPLLQLRYMGAPVHLRGLLVAGIIISALGAVMDIAMSISSSIEEIHAANPKMKQKELFRSGMNIGRDMVGTMTNTLILAFLGSEFTLIIFFQSCGYSFYHLYSTAFVALETISGLSSSLGLILAVPLTAYISSRMTVNKQ